MELSWEKLSLDIGEYAGETKSGIDTGFEVIKDPHFMHLKYFSFFIVMYM